jgi:NAD(P)-dependent dehydrogenase (short-subunit alcohol dehydrogenase family)
MEGRVCVVTGSSRGLGRAIADHLAAGGASVALCARDAVALEATAAELRARHGAPIHSVAVDVSDAGAMEAFARATLEALGPAHTVICNAGVLGPVGPIFSVDAAQWSDALAVNVLGVVHTMRAFVPHMVEQGDGVVLNVLGGGVGGDGLQSFIDAYVASKGAVAVLTETTARELAPHGVRVNAFSPGPLGTELMRPVLDGGPEASDDRLFDAARAIYRDAPAGDVAVPEILELIDFLLSDDARNLTGRLLSVRWNPVQQLRGEIDAIAESCRYQLRRIDGDLFVARAEPTD